MKDLKKLKKEEGMSLIEVIIAVAIITLVVVALVELGVSSLRTADVTKSKSRAIQFTKQAIERARSVRDQEGTDFFTNTISSDGYYRLDSGGFSQQSSTAPTAPYGSFTIPGNERFRRVIYFDKDGGDTINMVVKTYWRQTQGQDFGVVRSATVLTNWRK